MLRDYGSELLNVLERLGRADQLLASAPTTFGPSISHVFRSLVPLIGEIASGANLRRSQILYFPPGRFVLNRDLRLAEEVFTVPKGVELFFANDAILRIGPGVTLVIEGTIRAGQQQILGFNRFELPALRSGSPSGAAFPVPEDTITWPLGFVTELPFGPRVPCGRVVITSDAVQAVYPEWWGARAWDQQESIQAATTPPLGHDSSDAFLGAIDTACIDRAVRRRSPITMALSGLYQVVRTLEVRPPEGPGGTSIPVSLVWRGGAGVRGLPTLVRNPRSAPAAPGDPPQVLLRLHSGVDFDIQDVNLAVKENVEGVLDVRCSEDDRSGRRGVLRRVTLLGGVEFMLRIVEVGASTARRLFVLDGCALEQIPGTASRNDIRMDTGGGVMLRVSDTVLGPPNVNNNVVELTPQGLDHSTCHLTGGAVLLEAITFHQSLGPRPSRDPPRLDEPDGQDVFLGAPSAASGRGSTQLTMLQCESQGWWLLGRSWEPPIPRQAVLMAVAHNASVWQRNRERRRAWVGERLASFPEGATPSVVWRGSAGQCVMIGCRLGESMVLDDHNAIVNMATVFINSNGADSRKLYRLEGHMISRDGGYVPVAGVDMADDTLDDDILHLYPVLEDGESLR